MPALDIQGRSVEDSTFVKLQQALAACSLASFVQSLFRFCFWLFVFRNKSQSYISSPAPKRLRRKARTGHAHAHERREKIDKRASSFENNPRTDQNGLLCSKSKNKNLYVKNKRKKQRETPTSFAFPSTRPRNHPKTKKRRRKTQKHRNQSPHNSLQIRLPLSTKSFIFSPILCSFRSVIFSCHSRDLSSISRLSSLSFFSSSNEARPATEAAKSPSAAKRARAAGRVRSSESEPCERCLPTRVDDGAPASL